MAAGMTASMPFQSAWIIDANNPQGGCSVANYDHNGYFASMTNLDAPFQADDHPDGCNSQFRVLCMTGNLSIITLYIGRGPKPGGVKKCVFGSSPYLYIKYFLKNKQKSKNISLKSCLIYKFSCLIKKYLEIIPLQSSSRKIEVNS